MTDTTTRTTPDPDQRGGPARFAPAVPPLADRPSVLQRVGSLAALLLIIIGVPALLYALSGPPPIPTRLPTRADLTASIGAQQLVTVLVAVVWLAWLQFVTCVIVETFSVLRHSGVPAPVPFAGPSQRLARVLVGSLLLAGVVGGQAAAVLASIDSARSASTQSAPVAPGSDTRTGAGSQHASKAGSSEHPDPASGRRGSASPASDRARQERAADGQRGAKVYTVKAPVGRHHDSLWAIAERHLGDGRRYKEIFALNEHREQPDGRSLHLARLIQPGWRLHMPEDAVGVPRVSPEEHQEHQEHAAGDPRSNGAEHRDPRPGRQQPGGRLPQSRPETSVPSASGSGGHAGAADRSATSGQPAAAPPNPLVAAFAEAGLFAAALLGALLLRRARTGGVVQPEGDALDAEVGLRVGADGERAAWLDTALRSLATSCSQSGHPLPSVYAALLDDSRVELLLTPARTDAPDPWRVADDGRRWVLARSATLSVVAGPAAYPALVCLGRDEDGRDVLIDLEASEGPVQISGDAVTGAQVATAIAVQLATMPWADDVRVSAYGLPAEVAALAADRLSTITTLEPAVERLEARVVGGADDVLTGRMSRMRGEAPEYVVLAGAASEALTARLAAATKGVRQAFGVVGVGALPGAQWVLEVDEAGTLAVPLLGLRVTAHRMVPRALAAVAELFTQAAAPAPPAEGRVAVPAPPTPVDDAAYAMAEVRVGVLGSVEVRAGGPIDASRIPLGQEIVTYLALHPGGVHPGVLAAAVWPRGVSHAVATATLERVRDWLGDDTDGSALLQTDESGRYALSQSVPVDWQALCAVLLRSRQAASRREEAEPLRRALRMVRGPLLQDRPTGRYSWLARTPLEATVPAVVVDAAHRLAEISGGDDPDDAVAAAEAGLRIAPTSQLLWRDLLTAGLATGGQAALRDVTARMLEVLDAQGVPVEAETEALLEHLADSGALSHAGARAATP